MTEKITEQENRAGARPKLLGRVGDYWNTRAKGYSMDVQEELNGESGKNWLDMIQKTAPKNGFGRVLDIGCGPGFFVTLLGQAGYRTTGIDCTENMIAEARRNAELFDLHPQLLRMDAQNLKFPDETFDLIVTRNVMWNLEYPEAAYREWLRVLRKGGILVNADGNYYLHYTDENYVAKNSVSGHKHMDGIDVSVIDTIARELPLSREHRPEWDLKILRKLGVEGAEVSTLKKEMVMTADGKSAEVIRNFVLVVKK